MIKNSLSLLILLIIYPVYAEKYCADFSLGSNQNCTGVEYTNTILKCPDGSNVQACTVSCPVTIDRECAADGHISYVSGAGPSCSGAIALPVGDNSVIDTPGTVVISLDCEVYASCQLDGCFNPNPGKPPLCVNQNLQFEPNFSPGACGQIPKSLSFNVKHDGQFLYKIPKPVTQNEIDYFNKVMAAIKDKNYMFFDSICKARAKKEGFPLPQDLCIAENPDFDDFVNNPSFSDQLNGNGCPKNGQPKTDFAVDAIDVEAR